MSVDEPGVAELPHRGPLQPEHQPGLALAQLVAAERWGTKGTPEGAHGGTPGTPGARGRGVCRPAKPGWTTAVGAPGGQGVRDPGAWALGYMGSCTRADREGMEAGLPAATAGPLPFCVTLHRDPDGLAPLRYRPHRGEGVRPALSRCPRG